MLVVKSSEDRHCTTCLGNLLPCLTVLRVKKFFSICSQTLCQFSFCLFLSPHITTPWRAWLHLHQVLAGSWGPPALKPSPGWTSPVLSAFPHRQVLQPPNHLGGPLLKSLQFIYVLSVADAQNWSQYSRHGLTAVEWDNHHFVQYTGYAPVKTAHNAVGLRCYRTSWLMFSLLSIKMPTYFSAELFPKQSVSSLHCCQRYSFPGAGLCVCPCWIP